MQHKLLLVSTFGVSIITIFAITTITNADTPHNAPPTQQTTTNTPTPVQQTTTNTPTPVQQTTTNTPSTGRRQVNAVTGQSTYVCNTNPNTTVRNSNNDVIAHVPSSTLTDGGRSYRNEPIGIN